MKSIFFSMIFFAVAVGVSTLAGCGTARTKWTDKTMRVMIDPEGVEASHYVKIQQALVASGKWVVVDRSDAYNAIMKEQQREHREQTDRFLDREKFAHWGKLYGVGGIVVAHAQCQVRDGWLLKKNYPHCQQYLAIVDSNSGEVITAVQDEADGGSYDYQLAPSWDEIVAKLNNDFPSHFEPNRNEKTLRDYQDLSQEEAARQKEQIAKQQADREIAKEKKE